MKSHDKKTSSKLKIGEVAEQAGVGVQTLHYYERQGLLPSAERTAGNHRVYPPETLRRVEFIKKAQVVGFTLDEIKELFELCHQPGSHSCRVAEIGEARLRDLTAQLEVIEAFRDAITAVLPQWKAMARRRNCAGEFCDLIENLPPPAVPAKIQKKLRLAKRKASPS